MITPQVAEIERAVRARFAAEFADGRLYSLGIYNRRKIAGTTIWSQHAWGNAWDIGVRPDQRPGLGDQVRTFLRVQDGDGVLAVGTILWKVRDHYDHLHVEGDPKKTGTPPIAGDGDEEDMNKFIAAEQTNLNAAGFTDSTGAKLKVDGVIGPKTQSAMLKRDKAAAAATVTIPKGTPISGTFSGKVT